MAYTQSQKMYSKILKNISPYEQNAAMINSIAVNQLINEKKNKPHTPFSNKIPSMWSEINGLLLERCIDLKIACDSILKEPYELYLFGSQISGISRSGFPDLDIWCVYKNGTYDEKKEILRLCNFKLDFCFVENINPAAKYIKLFA